MAEDDAASTERGTVWPTAKIYVVRSAATWRRRPLLTKLCTDVFGAQGKRPRRTCAQRRLLVVDIRQGVCSILRTVLSELVGGAPRVACPRRCGGGRSRRNSLVGPNAVGIPCEVAMEGKAFEKEYFCVQALRTRRWTRSEVSTECCRTLVAQAAVGEGHGVPTDVVARRERCDEKSRGAVCYITRRVRTPCEPVGGRAVRPA